MNFDTVTTSIQNLKDTTQKYHDPRPTPTVPISFRFAELPYPGADLECVARESRTRKLGDPVSNGTLRNFNAWTHFDLVNGNTGNCVIETGPLFLAVQPTLGGTWTQRNMGLHNRGRTYEYGKIGVSVGDADPISSQGGKTTTMGKGVGGWTRSDLHWHGWHQNFMTVTWSSTAAVIAWYAARLVPIPGKTANYTKGTAAYSICCGADHRDESGGALPALAHGRHRRPTQNWEIYSCTNLTPAQLDKLVKDKDMPSLFPLA